jgi:hypothetical protein
MNINADRIKRVITNLRQCDADHDKIGVYTFEDAIEAIEQLRKERDEARREVCYAECVVGAASGERYTPQGIAEIKGWDCFKNQETP